MEDDTRPFPIQGDEIARHTIKDVGSGAIRLPTSTIPWWLAEAAYETYAARNGPGRTLERLGECGGFGREELLELLGERVKARDCVRPLPWNFAIAKRGRT